MSQFPYPPGDEQVIAVECVPLEEASQRFLTADRPELAELYRLAAAACLGMTLVGAIVRNDLERNGVYQSKCEAVKE